MVGWKWLVRVKDGGQRGRVQDAVGPQIELLCSGGLQAQADQPCRLCPVDLRASFW